MDTENPWLDTEIKQVNKPSNKLYSREDRKSVNIEHTKEHVKEHIKESMKEHNKESMKENIEKENIKFGKVSLSSLNKKDKKFDDFFRILVDSFDPELPAKSKEFVVNNFGEEWMKQFQKNVDYLKKDLLNSNFYPNQKEILFLKYIFLLQQAL